LSLFQDVAATRVDDLSCERLDRSTLIVVSIFRTAFYILLYINMFIMFIYIIMHIVFQCFEFSSCYRVQSNPYFPFGEYLRTRTYDSHLSKYYPILNYKYASIFFVPRNPNVDIISHDLWDFQLYGDLKNRIRPYRRTSRLS